MTETETPSCLHLFIYIIFVGFDVFNPSREQKIRLIFYLHSLFLYLSDYHSHSTRIGNKLSTPRHITTSFNKSFLVMKFEQLRVWDPS